MYTFVKCITLNNMTCTHINSVHSTYSYIQPHMHTPSIEELGAITNQQQQEHQHTEHRHLSAFVSFVVVPNEASSNLSSFGVAPP
ncbi:unnamed protein product [Ceratitis capitata]|uniref:(Mediterranean fruit fly) hypothetical protein n=1 Tax=Ceratitis capitata TaxID=7213 RepID=A0A811VFI1_CERCA|nr:unnamed protein product [Ceratitis capitata]